MTQETQPPSGEASPDDVEATSSPGNSPADGGSSDDNGTVGSSKNTRWFIAGVIVLVLAVGGLIVYLQRPGVPDQPQQQSLDAAPDVELVMFDGSTRTFDHYAGTPLVANFWGSWCPPCVVEMPILEESFQKYSPQVAFIGIDTQDSRDNALETIELTGVTYEMADDRDASLFEAFGVFAMPTTFFLDEEGRIVRRHSGAIASSQLEEAIEQLIEGAEG